MGDKIEVLEDSLGEPDVKVSGCRDGRVALELTRYAAGHSAGRLGRGQVQAGRTLHDERVSAAAGSCGLADVMVDASDAVWVADGAL
ncbi:unnamed protein product [Phytophthora lilii]|uniref:Unnamed protein product n=1 Tax=Phytophthora lilii TaxID=2077276 RepID=A0A9W7CQK1_9STRA|nr:unnamed protein product [Phytophthora lilii]